jgi:hypothetical protein
MAPEPPPTLPKTECRRAEAEPTVTAQLETDFWETALWQSIAFTWNGEPSPPESHTSFASRWTGNFLYFAFRTRYRQLTICDRPTLDSRTPQLWNKEDVVEIFLAPDPDMINRYKEFEVSPSAQWIDIDLDRDHGKINYEWASGMEARTRIDKSLHQWQAEFRVSLMAFSPIQFKTGTEVAINAFRVELKSDLYLAWSPTYTPRPNFHVPSHFGRMVFIG